MRTSVLALLTIFLFSAAQAQNTDIRHNTISYPNLNTSQINALTTADGLRSGTTVYNSDLDCLVIYDGCNWATIDKDYLVEQNLEQEIVAPSPQANSYFGISHEVYDKILVVGESHRDIGSNTDQGIAHIFRKNGCSWQYFTPLQDFGGSAGEKFGLSVDIKPTGNPNELLIVVTGRTRAWTYKMSTDAQGNPLSVFSDQLLVNTSSKPWLYIRIGNQLLDDELVFTTGERFAIPYRNNSSNSQCFSTNPSNNNIEIFRRNNSGTYVSYHLAGGMNMVSQGVTIPNVSKGRRVFYAETSCNYFGGFPGTFKSLKRLDYLPPGGYNNYPGTLPSSPIIPFIDLHFNGKYSYLALGEKMGRNRKITIHKVSASGSFDESETVTESNVYECIAITPSACTNGAINNADYFGETLSISQDKLIVGAPGTAGGATYIYKKQGDWYLDKVLSGKSANHVSSTNENYVYSQIFFNGGEGKVFIGEW